MRTIFLTFVLCAATLCGTWAQPKHEVRAVWLATLGGMDWPRAKAVGPEGAARQRRELCDQLDRLRAAGFNTVLFQTRLRADVIYPSGLEPFAGCLTGAEGRAPGYDPLAFAVDECHRRGMELHAWIVTIPAGNARQAKRQGRRSLTRTRRELCKYHQGGWYLDPGLPATADYLAGLVREVVSRYDVDGIHLDYIRYPEGADAFPDADTYRRHGKGRSLRDWRRENITAIVRRLYREVKALKPWVRVSSSPVGKFCDTDLYSSRGWNAFHAVSQDAQGWLREGIQDLLFPMMYFRANGFYPFALDWQEHAAGRHVAPGLGAYCLAPSEQDWPLAELERQTDFTRRIGLHGHAWFRSRFVLDNVKGLLDALSGEFYSYPALLPPMTWLDSVPPAAPADPSLRRLADGSLEMSWSAPAGDDGKDGGLVYHLYASDRYPVDTDDARNLLETRLPSPACRYAADRRPRRRYFAVRAADRFGNESAPLALNRPAEFDLPLLNDGDTAFLPDMPSARRVAVRDALGYDLLQAPYAPRLSIASLPPGLHTVFVIDADGCEDLVGIIVK